MEIFSVVVVVVVVRHAQNVLSNSLKLSLNWRGCYFLLELSSQVSNTLLLIAV